MGIYNPSATTIIPGTTTITGGTANGILWNNGGVLAVGPATSDASGNLTAVGAKVSFGTGSGNTGLLKFTGGNANFRNFTDSANVPVIASIFAAGQSAVPAGGTTANGFVSTSTANFGVFFGSGAPSVSAAQGSLYLRSDGTTVNNRAYINTDGGTTWTALTTIG